MERGLRELDLILRRGDMDGENKSKLDRYFFASLLIGVTTYVGGATNEILLR